MRKLIAVVALSFLFVSSALADWTGKDASGSTITFKNPNPCTSAVCIPITSPVDSTGASFGVTGNPIFVAPGTGQTFPVSGNVGGPVNVTPTNCSGTITTGGTAQNAFTAQTTLHGFTLANIDASAGSGEALWFSMTTTAAATTAASYPLAPPAATSFSGYGTFTTPPGLGTNVALSVIAATTGHKFSCTWW